MFDSIHDRGLARRVKARLIAGEHTFFAVAQPGFELTAGKELSSLGLNVNSTFIEGGIEFSGRLNDCYRACLLARSVNRIIMRVESFKSGNYMGLERGIEGFPWELYIHPRSVLCFRSSARKSMIFHTGKLEEIFEKGIRKRLRDYVSSCYDELADPGEVTVFLRNDNNMCHTGIDASGALLYKRGFRSRIGKAPLRESTAALILLEAGLNNYSTLIDPMCGSGTFSLEAAAMITGTPPGMERDFTFFHWPCFKKNNFDFIKRGFLKDKIPPDNLKFNFITSDIDLKALAAAEFNCTSAFPGILNPVDGDFFDLTVPRKGEGSLLVMNPPYGKRFSGHDLVRLYKSIGEKIRCDLSNCGVAVIVPGVDSEKALGLNYTRKIPFMNGGIKSAVLFRDG